MKIIPSFLRLTLLSALSLVRLPAQTVDQIIIFKGTEFVQTSAGSAVVNPKAPGPSYGGPYSFNVSVQGDDLSGITAPVITLAPGSLFPSEDPTQHNGGTLTFNSNDQEWVYGLNGNNYGGVSLAARDASFAPGDYGMTVLGTSFTLHFPATSFPVNTPTVTLTGGSWVAGKYVIDVSQALTITTNAFTNFNQNADGAMELRVQDTAVDMFAFYSDDTAGPNFHTYTIPGGTLTAGRDYRGSAAFYGLMDRPTVPGLDSLNAAVYAMETQFTIATISAPTPGAQATFYRVGNLGNQDSGGGYSEVRDVTKTGGVIYAVGNTIAYDGSIQADTGFLWTSTAGMTALPNVVNTFTTNPGFVTGSAITPDAAYIAARTRAGSGGNQRHANRLTTSDFTNLDLGTISGFPAYSAAVSISNDGSVMYGFSLYAANPRIKAVRLDASGPTVTAIPFLNGSDNQSAPAPRAISSDGSVMIGTSSNFAVTGGNLNIAGNQAFRYLHGSGIVGFPFLGGGTWNGALALSADGNLALLTGNSTAYSGGEVYLHNQTGGTTTSLGAPTGYNNPSNGGGMNSDGTLVVAAFGLSPNSCFVRNGAGWHNLSTVMTRAGVDLTGWTLNSVFGMSPDGTLVWGAGNHNGSTEGWVVEFTAGYLAAYGSSHDFNADGKPDIILENTSTGTRGFWLMNGTAVSSWSLLSGVATQWRIAAAADFNADGKPDLLWENTVTGDRAFWLMNGTAFSSSVYLTNLDPAWRFAGAADFNADGKPDIILENTSTGVRGIWLMNGTAVSSWVFVSGAGTEWKIAAAADFNADFKPDLVLENTVTGARGFWLMNGTSISSWVFLSGVATDWKIAAAADYTGDGKSDLLWQNTVTGDRAFWQMNGTAFSSGIYLSNLATDWRIAP